MFGSRVVHVWLMRHCVWILVQGMGKTVQMISLILTERSPENMPTLVVCPAGVMEQWVAEIKKYCTRAASVKTLKYHGANRRKDPDFIKSHDVVITSYAILALEANVKRKPEAVAKRGDDCVKALSSVQWFRIVLDECQTVKTHSGKTAIACLSYAACHRWCLSGTPVQNRPLELLSYYRFLRYRPFNSSQFLQEMISRAAKGKEKLAGELIAQSFAAVSLRRTKGAPSIECGLCLVRVGVLLLSFTFSFLS
jgi:SNF2 family DNA or RNA helicase